MRPLCVAISLTLAFAVGVVSVGADARFFSGPVSGAMTVFPLSDGISNSARLKLRGDGFEIVARNTDSGAVDALIACLPCVPGDEIDLSAVFANDDLGEGTVTVGDERLRQAYVAGHLTITAGIVRVPHRGKDTLSLSAPFSLADSGELKIFTEDWARFTQQPEHLWATGSVTGYGRATLHLTRLAGIDAVAYVVDRIRYAFTTPSTEDPLPVGVTLLGTLDGEPRPVGR